MDLVSFNRSLTDSDPPDRLGRRARRAPATGNLDAEWRAMVAELLAG